MNKRQVLFSLILVALLTLLFSAVASGKGHVPGNKVQVCHKGIVKEVGAPALGDHLGHGDFQVPACSLLIVKHKGDSCADLADVAPADGKADGAGAVVNFTNACDGSTF